jgi:putative heme-binding domain-containing protein
MRTRFTLTLFVASALPAVQAAEKRPGLPAVADGWSIELVAQAPRVLFPTAIVAAPDGTVYVGSDPMDMPGPPTEPIDRVIALKGAGTTVFADKLWSVMGLEWLDDTLYVVHAPFLSAFRDRDGDGKADSRVDLITGLGPEVPGFNGINDHIASGIRLGMDGFLYISVGDKGIPHGVGRDGKTIRLFGGGVIRVRPDGTGLEIVSTGERNPLSVALSATDEVFTFGNDDDSKRWPNSLTHHVVGGHYGYPYQFLAAPKRALPIMTGQVGGSGAQGICYNEDGLPDEYSGNLFFCDWGLQTVFRFEIRKAGGTHTVTRRSNLVEKGNAAGFRPFSLAVAKDPATLWLVDWGFDGWLADGPKTGRLYRLSYHGQNAKIDGKSLTSAAPRPTGTDPDLRLKSLDHPSLSVRLESQRILARMGPAIVPKLVARLSAPEPETGRLHALWALDAIGGDEARRAISALLVDSSARVRLQAARSVGIAGDRTAVPHLVTLLRDRDSAVRREAAVALGKLGDTSSAPALYAAMGDSDRFAAWSIRQAIRQLQVWDTARLIEALLDERRLEPALRLTDEAWSTEVVAALSEALKHTESPTRRAWIVSNLAGLYRQYPEWTGYWFGTNPLAGQFPQKTKDWAPDGMKAVLDGLSMGLADSNASVRMAAIAGLAEAGKEAAPRLRGALANETDSGNQAVLVETLGALQDRPSVPLFAAIMADAGRDLNVRAAAITALAPYRDPESLRAKFSLVYDEKTPPALVARALPDLARLGFLPPNDLSSFFWNPAPEVRTAALLSLNVKKALPPDIQQSILDRLDDKSGDVRQAAMLAVVPLRLQAAVPRLLAIASNPASADFEAAFSALCALADPRAVSVYLTAIEHRNPGVRKAAETALLAVRDRAAGEIDSAARSGRFSPPAALSLDRVLAQFTPVRQWRVIGPFPRTTAQIFIGQSSIDFTRAQTGAVGHAVKWSAREADASTGRVDLEDLKEKSGENGGFGYDSTGSPDLGAFAYAEVEAESAGTALLMVGSSGPIVVTINERPAHQFTGIAGRSFQPDSDLARISLQKGRNRILVVSRQGVGKWCFSVQIGRLAPGAQRPVTALAATEVLRRFAMEHRGESARGEELFFGPRGAGCAQCHSAGGRGTSTIGPDLTGLASKYDRAEVIRSVLEPSNRIATGFQPVVLATRDGKVETGVIRAENEQMIEIAGSDAKIMRIPKKDIETRRIGDVSVMPTGLVETLSPTDFADLVSYLLSLRQVASSTRPAAR